MFRSLRGVPSFDERSDVMADTRRWESFKAEGDQIVERLKKLVHEGNVRRIVVEHEGRTIAEFPLTVGVIGIVVAPVLAAIGMLVAVLENCTIQVERSVPAKEKQKDTVHVA
jgi:hypothetical protein